MILENLKYSGVVIGDQEKILSSDLRNSLLSMQINYKYIMDLISEAF
jgi:hypothetical protein